MYKVFRQRYVLEEVKVKEASILGN